MNRLGLIAFVPLLVTGCFLKDFTTVARPQLEDSVPTVQTVGDAAAEFDNATDLFVTGFGLVDGLNGTGGSTPPCDARTAVIERLKRAKVENPADIIDSKDCAVVIVTAVIRPGVRRDELVDCEITLPQGSKVKSLRGGMLQPTPLMTFATQGDVREYLKNNDFGTSSEGNHTNGTYATNVFGGSF